MELEKSIKKTVGTMGFSSYQEMTQKSIHFQLGAEQFRKLHNLPEKYPKARKMLEEKPQETPPLVIFKWYKKTVSNSQWNYYFLYSGHAILEKSKNDITFAFMS